jgi:hypothetical protein
MAINESRFFCSSKEVRVVLRAGFGESRPPSPPKKLVGDANHAMR